MNTASAASELGMTPKALRRYLRKHPEFVPVGAGKTYTLTEDQVLAIREMLSPIEDTEVDSTELEYLNDDAPLSIEVITKIHKCRATRTQVMTKYGQRQAKLLERLQALQLA